MADDEISEEGRRARFARWEAIGVDRIKADLLDGGHRLVGGTPAVRKLAWEWVRMKEAEQHEEAERRELVTLKPTLWGNSIDLKELWRRIARRFKEGGNMTKSNETYVAELVDVKDLAVSYGDPHVFEALSADEAITKAHEWAKSQTIGKKVLLRLKKRDAPWGVYHEPIDLSS
jgi:hypothetical protein